MIKKNRTSLFIVFLCAYQTAIAMTTEGTLVRVPRPEIVIDHEADLLHKKQYLKEKARNKFVKTFDAQDAALFEESFEQAPIKVKGLVNAMLRGDSFTHNSILLTGPTGFGKSTLAQAIAYKLQRKCVIILAPSLLGRYRDQEAESVLRMFKDVDQNKEKPVLILEEINELTDGHTSEHSDTKYTAMQLWTLLDSYCKDKNFLLIGTTSETKKMSPQLQSRFKGRTFVMDSLSSEARKRTIEFVFKKIGIEKDETCDEAYLIDLAQKIAHFSQRDIEALIQTSLLLSVTHNSQALTRVATKECLELAYAQIVQENEKLWDFSEHTTDEERRHR